MPDPRAAPATARRGAIGAGIGAAIGAAVLIAAPIAQHFEGYSGKVYLDPARIPTQCYGETRDLDPARIYSADQCAAKLRDRMGRDYAPRIIACVPSFAEPAHRYAFAALIDAAYNAGPVAVCSSPAARAFNAGRYRAGCDALAGWYTSARNRATGARTVFPGLVRRRAYERSVCLTAAR